MSKKLGKIYLIKSMNIQDFKKIEPIAKAYSLPVPLIKLRLTAPKKKSQNVNEIKN